MIRMILLSARPWSFVLSISTALVGTVLALNYGSFHLWRFVLLLPGLLCFHAALNLINDYFDVKHGVDAPGVATAVYRPHPLVEGKLQPRQIVVAAAVLYVVGLAIGVVLASMAGWELLGLLALGFLFSYFYTGDPINFKRRAMGELVMFVATGPIMFTGVYFVQTGSFEPLGAVLLLSVPTGLWWTLPLVANNMKDMETDKNTLGETMATRLGRKGSLVLYTGIAATIYLSTALGVALQVVPLWALLVFATLPRMIRLIRSFAGAAEIPADADPQTMQIGMPFSAILVAAFLVQYFTPWPGIL